MENENSLLNDQSYGEPFEPAGSPSHDDMFKNRLRKMHRHFSKWARRSHIDCYRIFDSDIPGFPVSVDIYGDHVYVSEHKRKVGFSDDQMDDWRDGMVTTIAHVLQVDISRVHYRVRFRQFGSNRYEKISRKREIIPVHEGGLEFGVNLSDYMDTGLFLDHRITRSLVRSEAKDRRFLNLFSYTGSFSVYAASGGAASTLSVDMSNTYTDWAEDNLIRNGFSGNRHQLIREDVLEFLRERNTDRFDLAVLDPPTFSNSKKMKDVLDIQRDHPLLLNLLLNKMTPGGIIYFSTNARTFKPDFASLSGATIKDITNQTIPPDFRNKRVHYCYRLVKD